MLQQWASIEVLEAKPGNAILERMLLQAPDNWPLILEEVKDTARVRGRDSLSGCPCRLTWRAGRLTRVAECETQETRGALLV